MLNNLRMTSNEDEKLIGQIGSSAAILFCRRHKRIVQHIFVKLILKKFNCGVTLFVDD